MSKRANTDEILNSVEGIQPAAPKPFFTGRTLLRLQTEWAGDMPLMSPRFKLLLTGVVLLIAVNILLVISKYRAESNPALTEWKNTTPEWVIDYTENPGSSLNPVPNK